jgi:hypothetical protein
MGMEVPKFISRAGLMGSRTVSEGVDGGGSRTVDGAGLGRPTVPVPEGRRSD